MNQVNHISKAGSQRHCDGLERSPGQFSLVREGWKILEHWMLLTQMAGSGRVLKWESLACWGPRGMCRTLGSGEGRKLKCSWIACYIRVLYVLSKSKSEKPRHGSDSTHPPFYACALERAWNGRWKSWALLPLLVWASSQPATQPSRDFYLLSVK